MIGGFYFGSGYLGGYTGATGIRRLLRPYMRLLNGLRTMRQVKT